MASRTRSSSEHQRNDCGPKGNACRDDTVPGRMLRNSNASSCESNVEGNLHIAVNDDDIGTETSTRGLLERLELQELEEKALTHEQKDKRQGHVKVRTMELKASEQQLTYKQHLHPKRRKRPHTLDREKGIASPNGGRGVAFFIPPDGILSVRIIPDAVRQQNDSGRDHTAHSRTAIAWAVGFGYGLSVVMFSASVAATALNAVRQEPDIVNIVAMFAASSAVLVGVMAIHSSRRVRFSLRSKKVQQCI